MSDLDILRNHFLGFNDDFFSDFFVKTHNTYPPYNVKEKDDKGLIELAVAGFKEKDLKIEVKDNLLSIYGCKEIDDKNISKLYSIHRGIANRNFTRKFKLHEYIVINGGFGLIGSEIAEKCLRSGAQILIVDNNTINII